MSTRSIESKIKRIERILSETKPGKRVAYKWIGYLKRRAKIGIWIYKTEEKKPDILPPGHPDFTPKGSMERRLAMKKWRQERKDEWVRRYGSDVIEERDQNNYLIKSVSILPDPTESREIFNHMIACTPPGVFIWSKYMKNYYFSFPSEMRTWGMRSLALSAQNFLIIESRATYWKKRIDNRNLEDIPLPEWAASKCNKSTYSEAGRLPPFIFPIL